MGVGVLAPNKIESDARIVGYDKELRMKSVLDDIYGKLKGTYDPVTKTMPDAIVMKVDSRVLSESSDAVITMQMPMNGGGVYGNDRAIGKETRPTHKSLKIYRNNLRRVVTTPGDGVRELDAKPYGMYEKYIDQLGDWNQAHTGMEYRQSYVETFGETLVYGDTESLCTRNWNMNVAVAGLPLRTMRATYSSNRATYTNNIVAKILASGGNSFTPIAAQTLNQPNLSNLSNLAKQLRITKLSLPGLPGGKGYILTVSELQATYLGDPAWSARNLGSLYKDVSCLNSKVMEWPGVIGSWKDILFIMDDRLPTVTPSGTSEPYGLTAGYVEPIDVDSRNRDNSNTRDCSILHGRASVIDWTPRKLRHIKQDDDYEAIKGHGTSVIRGVQNPIFGGTEQYSSILFLLGLPDYV